MTPDLLAFVRVLSDAGVDYVIVGGVAANKRAAGRAKDRESLAELEALLEERDRA